MVLQSRRQRIFQSEAAGIAGVYGIFAFLWILSSDWILATLVSDVKTLSFLQTIKGWLFVAVTMALVYGLVHRQVARLRSAESSLQRSEEKYRELVEGTDDLITQVDGQGRFTYVNHSSSRYLGLAPTECIGLSAFDFVHPDDRDRTHLWFRDCLVHQSTGVAIENRQISRSGEVTPMLWTVNFSYDPQGELQGIRSIARDISTQKKAEQVLHENLRMRSEFISTAAHELRTPLAVIMGYSELLVQEKDMGGFSDKQKLEFAETIYEKAQVLSSIVDELLDLSKIDAGQRLSIDIHECNLWERLEKTVKEFKARHPGREVNLNNCDGCMHRCWADPGRMQQVLENLMENAAKYSPPHAPISVGCSRTETHCSLYVQDWGVGMSEDQIGKIFDKFYRVDASNTAVSGLGLGLSIVRYIVEGHGGKIEVESQPGAGTTMKVLLPHYSRETSFLASAQESFRPPG